MNNPGKLWLVAAALAGATGVGLGAFAAHGLDQYLINQSFADDLIAKRIDQFKTGSHYHLIHALALLGIAALHLAGVTGKALQFSGFLFAGGIVFFSGSLYILVLTNTTWWGAITPIGGLAWIIAWVLLAFCQMPRSESPGQ